MTKVTNKCPEVLAQLMELANEIPHPYQWPRDYKWPEKDEGEPDWTLPYRPIETRLIHPEVIAAEVEHFFNFECAISIDAAFAAKFEQAFFEGAGHFSFGSRAKTIIGEFLSEHGRVTRTQVEKSLEPFTYIDKFLSTETVKVRYGRLLVDRIRRFGLSERLVEYLKGHFLPATEVELEWGQGEVKQRWVDFWHAYYSLGDVAFIPESKRSDGVITQSRKTGAYIPLYADERGIVRAVQPLFLRIITTHDIEAGRVRTCKECVSFFWAKRLDQLCCGRRCTNAYNVRRFRSKQKETVGTPEKESPTGKSSKKKVAVKRKVKSKQAAKT